MVNPRHRPIAFAAAVLAAVLVPPLATAQEDGSQIILPVEAQTCNLPAAPARIPDEASYDDLLKAKEAITAFQSSLSASRECLDKSKSAPEVTQGNLIALNNAHNYSVEMEQRVAEQVNVAVRAYKARQEEEGG
ncbi:MAG: hypothetical protein P8008_05440 [Gammaproteobacteria bacterium]